MLSTSATRWHECSRKCIQLILIVFCVCVFVLFCFVLNFYIYTFSFFASFFLIFMDDFFLLFLFCLFVCAFVSTFIQMTKQIRTGGQSKHHRWLAAGKVWKVDEFETWPAAGTKPKLQTSDSGILPPCSAILITLWKGHYLPYVSAHQ